MTWQDRPQHGERWRRRKNGKTETRTVVDRNLGGDVFYVAGRPAYRYQCTEAEWHAWVKDAKEIL